MEHTRQTAGDGPPAAAPLRLRHVDSLRAVAAGLVMWSHLDQTLAALTAGGPRWLGFLHRLPHTMDLGLLGVMIFFAVSGFVICRSFGGPRQGGARCFVLKRFCRLYPAYWVSMLGGLWVWWLTGRTPTWGVVAANATMVPSLFGQPYLLGVYWTLEIELLFYALCLGLYLARSLERRALLGGFVVGLSALPRVLHLIDRHVGTHWGLPTGKSILVYGLAVMFWGALFRLAYEETGGFRRGIFTGRGTWWVVVLALVLCDVPDPNLKWYLLGLRPGPMPGHVSVVVALGVFTLWVAWLRVDNVVLTYLGLISYSVYLFHPVAKYTAAALLADRPWHLPLPVVLPACVAVTVAVAMPVYRWVERPAIARGKRWTGWGRATLGGS